MRIAKLEKDRTLKRQVINWLASGITQQTIAGNVGLNQSQISRFAAKYRNKIEFQKRELEFKKHMRIIEMAFNPQWYKKGRRYQSSPTSDLSPDLVKLWTDCGILKGKEGEKP